jgi:DNA-binding response OmpR family regulator
MGRILIVEDERPLAELLAWVLQQEGHEVFVANTAGDAVRQGLNELPELVVADWMLRHSMHGGEVCLRIRAACPATKMILMTGHPEVVPQARACGWIDAVLEKPFHMRHLLKAVRSLLWQDEYAWVTLGAAAPRSVACPTCVPRS